jgi:hypothetical protein
VIPVFTAQDVGHQRGAHKALWNGAAWHLSLNNGLTTGAGQTRPANLVHDVMARDILQLLHHIRSQHFEAAAAIGAGVTGGDRLLDALEVFGEWFARTRRAGLICGLSIRRRFLFNWGLSGLLNLKLFKDQLQRQLRAAF